MENNNKIKFRFQLSKQKKLGLWLICLLLLLLIVFRSILSFSENKLKNQDDLVFQESWEAFLQENKEIVSTEDTTQYSAPSSSKVNLFPFNPNTITEQELESFQLPAKTIKAWINYRNKGGKFYKKEDLKKLYTLSEKDYHRLYPYLQINDFKTVEKPEKSVVSEKPSVITPININTADTNELKKLKGIGSVLAKRILAFRNNLGGFYEIEQLSEVYRLPDSIVEINKDLIVIDQNQIKKINLNEADYNTLSKHPYLRPFSKEILKVRNKSGNFSDISEIQQIKLINEEKYRKIAPYLST